MQMPPPQVTGSGTSGLNGGDSDDSSKKNGAQVTTRFRVQPKASIAAAKTLDPITEVEYVAETKLPTDIGQFQLRAYRVPGAPVGQEPCVIYSRDKPPFGMSASALAEHVPVRIHDQCLTSEVFRSQRYVVTFVENLCLFVF